jgi:hypothetical protein
MFMLKDFPVVYAASLAALAGAEKITRAELSTLSRITLEALHTEVEGNKVYGDIRIINDILPALTPVNRQVVIEFFKEFSGFSFDGKNNRFTSKDKKNYDAAVALSEDFLEDPLNNLWTWANRNVEVTKKEFNISQSMGALLKKAHNKGVSNNDILKAVMSNGLSVDDLIAFMGTIEGGELEVK